MKLFYCENSCLLTEGWPGWAGLCECYFLFTRSVSYLLHRLFSDCGFAAKIMSKNKLTGYTQNTIPLAMQHLPPI